MKRAHFPIALLMAAVAAVAINLAVWRSIDWTSGAEGLSHFFFACGVMPMASLLILVALKSAPSLMRTGCVSPFVVGFEALGWAAVFAFVTCYSVAPWLLLAYAELIGVYTRPIFERYLAQTPSWVGLYIELGAGVIIILPPLLLVALLGGWLTRKLGITVRFERERTYPAESGPGPVPPDSAIERALFASMSESTNEY
jgi:hypothetical protein